MYMIWKNDLARPRRFVHKYMPSSIPFRLILTWLVFMEKPLIVLAEIFICKVGNVK